MWYNWLKLTMRCVSDNWDDYWMTVICPWDEYCEKTVVSLIDNYLDAGVNEQVMFSVLQGQNYCDMDVRLIWDVYMMTALFSMKYIKSLSCKYEMTVLWLWDVCEMTVWWQWDEFEMTVRWL